LSTRSAGSPTEGVITEFAIPTADSSPQVIAAGPDDALWFTEFSANKIGRITADESGDVQVAARRGSKR
jgi:virginiamycin B lyase